MLLLIAGSNETARQLIVDTFLGDHDDWKHLALEDIEVSMDKEASKEDVLGIQEAFMVMVACECAKEAQRDGHHVVITCPKSEMIESVFEHFPETPVTIYLGTPNEADGFDHIIDTRKSSSKDVSNFLSSLVGAMPA